MLSINTNLSSLIAQNSMSSATKLLNQAVERMTTGYKINHAKDNAANYSIATNMTTKINSYMVAEDNCAMGLDMLASANGSLDQISDKLTRLRDLQTQASNGTYGATSLNAINAEANALVDEINRLYQTAEYNGMKLFDNPTSSFSLATPINTNYSNPRAIPVDESKRVSNVSTFISGETYYITTSDDLIALQNLVKEIGNSTDDVTFELASDIDMSGIEFEGIGEPGEVGSDSFAGIFNGNGFTISNLTSTSGLFKVAVSATITDLKLININSNSGVIDFTRGKNNIRNCYVSGNLVLGGIIGRGGYVPSSWAGDSISNCTVEANFSGANAGGIIGSPPHADDAILTSIVNCTVLGNTSLAGVFCGNGNWQSITIESCKYDSSYDERGIPLCGGVFDSSSIIQNNTPISINSEDIQEDGEILLQVGVDSKKASQIGVGIKFTLDNPDELRMIGLDLTTDYLTKIDEMLAMVSEKQTEYGAAQNRLESALESIAVNIENLTSSRSTIRDADIAEVSSEYIRQQILQQASATLLATANQSPSIALQLI